MAEREIAKEISLGRIRARIVKNRSEDRGAWFGVTLVRKYWTGEEERESTIYFRDDLPVLRQALEMAYAWIWEQEAVKSPATPEATADEEMAA